MNEKTHTECTEREASEAISVAARLPAARGLWIAILDDHECVLLWNDAAERISGYAREDVLGNNNIWGLLYPDPHDRQTCRDAIRRAFEQKLSIDFELAIRTKNDKRKWLTWCGEPVIRKDGSNDRLILVGYEALPKHVRAQARNAVGSQRITQRPAAEEYLATMAHELRTPLAIAQGFANLLASEDLTPEQKDKIGKIRAQIERIEALITDWPFLGRSDGEADERTEMSTDLEALFGQILRSLNPLLEAKRHDLEFRQRSPKPRLRTNPDALTHILTNLLSNAINYTPVGGRISIDVTDRKKETHIEINDSGIGIPVADQARIFDAFYRTEQAKRMNEEGTGLGLHIARRLAESLGGSLRVRSAGESEGTTFILVLPREKG